MISWRCLTNPTRESVLDPFLPVIIRKTSKRKFHVGWAELIWTTLLVKDLCTQFSNCVLYKVVRRSRDQGSGAKARDQRSPRWLRPFDFHWPVCRSLTICEVASPTSYRSSVKFQISPQLNFSFTSQLLPAVSILLSLVCCFWQTPVPHLKA